MDLLAVRKSFGFGKLEAAVLAIYTAVLAFVIPFHEPWFDEAQAWLIARDSSLAEIFLRRLHYEGAPGLWSLILWAATRLHMPYRMFGWLAASFAVAGIYVLLRYSPFPLIIRILLPLTFFLQYQYAVVARGYVLFPLLLFSLCALYTLEPPRPVWFAIVAGLLVNLSLHGAIVAWTLSALYFYERIRKSRRTSTPIPVALPACIFILSAFISAATAVPAPDVGFAVQKQVSQPLIHRLLIKWMPEASGSPGVPPPVPDFEITRDPAADTPAGIWFWNAFYHQNGSSLHKLFLRFAARLYMLGCIITYPISTSNLLAIVFLACTVAWMALSSNLRYLLPYLALLLLCAAIWIFEHHTGMLFITLLAGLWLSYSQIQKRPNSPQPPAWLSACFVSLLTLILVLHVSWSIHSIALDRSSPYDPGKTTAAFLKEHAAGKSVAALAFEVFAVEPYFDHPTFSNSKTAYYLWSSNTNVLTHLPEAVQQKPDYIVAATVLYGDQVLRDQLVHLISPGTLLNPPPFEPYLVENGYRKTNTFCGDKPMRFGTSNRICDVIYQPAATISSTSLTR